MSEAPATAVSVILPTRNRAGVLPRAIDSALRQEGVTLELIVVDDGSTDSTADLLRERSRRDPRLRVIRNPGPLGAAAARNKAAAQAYGDYLAFLDDDDEWLPRKLARQVESARRESADVVHCRFIELGSDGSEISAGDVDLGRRPRTVLVRGNVLGLSSVLVRRVVFHEVGGFDTRLPRLQDWDLWIRLAGHHRFAFLDAPCARIHRLAESISTDQGALARAADLLAAKYRDEIPLQCSDHADLLVSLARLLARAGDGATAQRLAVRAMREHSWSPLRTAEALLITLGPGPYRGARRVARMLLPRWLVGGGRFR